MNVGYSAAVRRAIIVRRRGLDDVESVTEFAAKHQRSEVHVYEVLHACTALISPDDSYRACRWCRFGVLALPGHRIIFPEPKRRVHRMRYSILSSLSHIELISRMVTGLRTTAVEDVRWG
jgi:hypothetical protein